MGLGASTEATDPDAQLDGVINREYGFRVHRVEVGSPGEMAGLQSILDYIVVADGVRLDADDGTETHRCGCSPARLKQPPAHAMRAWRAGHSARRPHALNSFRLQAHRTPPVLAMY
jgi:hypothetical protein